MASAAGRLTLTSHMLSSPQMWHGSLPLGRRALSPLAPPPAPHAAFAPHTILPTLLAVGDRRGWLVRGPGDRPGQQAGLDEPKNKLALPQSFRPATAAAQMPMRAPIAPMGLPVQGTRAGRHLSAHAAAAAAPALLPPSLPPHLWLYMTVQGGHTDNHCRVSRLLVSLSVDVAGRGGRPRCTPNSRTSLGMRFALPSSLLVTQQALRNTGSGGRDALDAAAAPAAPPSPSTASMRGAVGGAVGQKATPGLAAHDSFRGWANHVQGQPPSTNRVASPTSIFANKNASSAE